MSIKITYVRSNDMVSQGIPVGEYELPARILFNICKEVWSKFARFPENIDFLSTFYADVDPEIKNIHARLKLHQRIFNVTDNDLYGSGLSGDIDYFSEVHFSTFHQDCETADRIRDELDRSVQLFKVKIDDRNLDAILNI